MADKEHIDSFLRENLGNWEVDAPPDAWLAISKGLGASTPPAAPQANAAGNSLFAPLAKITAAVLGLGIASFASLIYFSNSTPKNTTSNQEPIQSLAKLPQSDNQPDPKENSDFAAAEKLSVKKNSSSSKPVAGYSSSSNPEPADQGKMAKSDAGSIQVNAEETSIKRPEPSSSITRNQTEKEPEDSREEEDQLNPNALPADEPKPVIHTAFSPDGDGVNDELVLEMPPLSFFRMRIFSLKGQLVFETDKPNQFWKGQIGQSGIPAESGNYRFVLDYQVKGFEKVRSQTGLIFLAR